MKRNNITDFLGGMAVGAILTLLCVFIIVQEKNYEQDTTGKEIVSSVEVNENHAETAEVFVTHEPIDLKPQEETKSTFTLKDDKGEFTKEAIELAEIYLVKYNYDEWHGSIVDSDTGITVSIDWGIIELEGEKTTVKTEERAICDKAIESYMSGEWDGTEMITSEGHTIKLSEGGGYLLLDGYICIGQKNLDIPDSAYELFYDDISSYEYVPGQGTYVIIDKKLVKFLRGEKIALPGEDLSWIGFQNKEDLYSKIGIDSAILYNLPTLIYNKIDGMLYLITGDETCNLSNSENYVYVFDDCNLSRMRYIGRADFEHQYPGNVDIDCVIIQ